MHVFGLVSAKTGFSFCQFDEYKIVKLCLYKTITNIKAIIFLTYKGILRTRHFQYTYINFTKCLLLLKCCSSLTMYWFYLFPF